jgi:hypothetical protein
MELRQEGGRLELDSIETPGNHEHAWLDQGMVQTRVSIEAPAGAAASNRLYALDAEGNAWLVQGGPAPRVARGRDSVLGDRSFFFILPRLIDLRRPGAEATLGLILPSRGRQATMRLRSSGLVTAPDAAGRARQAYKATLDLADPLLRLLWPYTYCYYYLADDLVFLRYEGPDEARKPSSIALLAEGGP